jgi:hypothetical protein
MRYFVLRAVVAASLLLGGCCRLPWPARPASARSEQPPFAGELGAMPWTHLAFADDPTNFHFAIVADRCGGHRPGIFEDALNKLNLLQPEFVLSVGDLIEGYTQEEPVLNEMWRESQAMLSRLQMPFFRVPGNHDLSNAFMDQQWDRHFGKRYYWFTYKGALFLCLNSQDNAERRTGLSAEQIAWARAVIARHADARWTFLFLHQPLWVYDEGAMETSRKSIKEKQNTGFAQIESALAGRNYTVFAGHFHQYVKYVRHGQQYFILASTGGASALRGPGQGEFDHVVWVAMSPGGPLVANLTLDGILRDDVYTEGHLLAARDLRFDTKLLPLTAPSLSVTVPLAWTNPFPRAVQAELAWSVAGGSAWTVTPARVAAEIPPYGKIATEFHAALNQPEAALFPLPALHASLSISNCLAQEKTLLLPVDFKSYCLANLPELRCRPASGAVKVDGALDDQEWQRLPNVSRMTVRTLDRSPSVPTSFLLAYDATNLYVAARCTETNLAGLVTQTTQRDGHCWEDDSVEIFVATDPKRQTYYQFIVTAAGVMFDGKLFDSQWNGEWTAAAGRESDGWTLEIALPWKTLGLEVPAPDSRLGLELVRTRIQNNREMLQWAPAPDGNHSTDMFGFIRFEGTK